MSLPDHPEPLDSLPRYHPRRIAAEFARTGNLVRITDAEVDEWDTARLVHLPMMGTRKDGSPLELIHDCAELVAVSRKTFAGFNLVDPSTVTRWIQKGLWQTPDGFIPYDAGHAWLENYKEKVKEARLTGRMDGIPWDER